MTLPDAILSGPIEDGYPHILVKLGRLLIKQNDCLMMEKPTEVRLDSGARWSSISRRFADQLGASVHDDPHEGPQTTVCLAVLDNQRKEVWRARITVSVMESDRHPPTLGAQQLLDWNLSLKGSDGSFTLSIPQ